MIFHLIFSPETLGNVGILFFLLDHQASLPSEGNHRGQDGELVDVGVEVVQPELVHRQEGSGPSHSSAAVHQDCPLELSIGFHKDLSQYTLIYLICQLEIERFVDKVQQ